MTTKTKAASKPITNIVDLVHGAGGKVSFKSFTASDVRIKTDIVKRKLPHGVKGSSHKTVNSVGVIGELVLVSTAGFESAIKVAYVSRATSDLITSLNKSLTVFDVVSNATLVPDFFSPELIDDLVECHSIKIIDEDFRDRLIGIESALCQFWDDRDEKTIHIDYDHSVGELLREYNNAVDQDASPNTKKKGFTKKLLAEIDSAVKASALKFISE